MEKRIRFWVSIAVIVGGPVMIVHVLTPARVKELRRLERILKYGAPEQKEEVLELFRETGRVDFVPAVIEAIRDNTRLPRRGCAGWGTVYHQAATAMDEFARRLDGKSLKERGKEEYSFSGDVGRASRKRRMEVYRNWKTWWEQNKGAVKAKYVRTQPPKGRGPRAMAED